VNLASGPGFLLAFPLSNDRLSLAAADKVDDNMAKQQLDRDSALSPTSKSRRTTRCFC
jgi:hypothetical protein